MGVAASWRFLLCGVVACGGGSGDNPPGDGNPPPHDTTPPGDAPPCAPATLFIVSGGGTYTAGTNDAGANTIDFLSGKNTVTFAPYTAITLSTALDCIGVRLAPFQITLADVDPGTADHIEIVLSPGDSKEVGLAAGVISVTPVSCQAPHQNNVVAAAWPQTGNDDANETCDMVTQIVGQLAGLDFTSECNDAMAFNILGAGCGGAFTDTAQACNSGTCRCGGTTQNSLQGMVASYCAR